MPLVQKCLLPPDRALTKTDYEIAEERKTMKKLLIDHPHEESGHVSIQEDDQQVEISDHESFKHPNEITGGDESMKTAS